MAKSFALLLDIGGNDRYMDWEKEADKLTPNEKCGDNSTWYSPAREDPHYGADNFGVGMDVEDGAVPEAGMFDK